MSIIAILARTLAADDFDGAWPTRVDEDGELIVPTCVTQTGNMTLSFNEPVFSYTHWRTKEQCFHECLEDVEGMPFIGEYGEGETITKAEYEAFLQDVVGGDASQLEVYFAAKVRDNVAKISDLNEQVGKLVNEIARLSAEAGIEATIDLGARGSLELDGPWDSSSAYC